MPKALLAAVLACLIGLAAAPMAAPAATAKALSAGAENAPGSSPHAGFLKALRRQGLPSGVPIPAWARQGSGQPYFAPAPADLLAEKSPAENRMFAPGAIDEAGEGGELELREEEVPPVRYHEGGMVQTTPHVHVIFWGSNFNQPTGAALRTQLLGMLKGLSGSAYHEILSQYFDESGYISNPSVDAFTDERKAAPIEVTAAVVEEEIIYALKAGPGWSREPNAQFMVVTAPGSTYDKDFVGHYCAFHAVDKGGSAYSFVPYAGDEPFRKGHHCDWYGHENVADATSALASHEYAETATDPYWEKPEDFGWQTSEGEELADLCATPSDKLPNGSMVQGLYDDHQNACSLSDEHPPHILAITEGATEVSKNSARMRGTVNPEGVATTFQFEYGTTESYGTTVPSTPASAGSGKPNVEVSQEISGLKLETTYHYRVVAKSSSGTTYGEDRTVIPSRWTMRQGERGKSWEGDELDGVSCLAFNWCEAVGEYRDNELEKPNQALAYGWNGSQWSLQSVPLPKTENIYNAKGVFVEMWYGFPGLSTVSCTSTSACTAVGQIELIETELGGEKKQLRRVVVPLIERWNGSTWSLESLSMPAGALELELNGVACAAASECIAVGAVKNGSGVWENYSARWKGSSWSALTTPTAAEASGHLSELTHVSCANTTTCMTVGWYNTGAGTKPVSEVWNGSSWTLQTRSHEGWLEGISCPSAKFCIAAGSDETIESWNGSTWSAMSVPSPEDVDGAWFNGASCISANDCVAVGAGWSKADEEPVTLVENWNGSTWSEQTTPRESEMANNELFSASCVSMGACMAVGMSKASGTWKSLIEARPSQFVAASYLSAFGSEGTGDGQLHWPTGAAVDASGNLWVVDTENNRVEKFNSKGEYLTKFGSAGTGNGQFVTPLGIALTATGNIWVTDAGNSRVQEFNSKGEYMAKFGSEGTGNGQFSEAWGIAIAPDGHIWVSDARYYRVEEFTATGEFVREAHGAGYGGTEDGELWHPTGLAVDAKGTLWIADTRNNRIQKFGPNGEFLMKFGSLGSGEGQIKEPTDVVIKPWGDPLVVDSGNGRIEEFSPDGEYLTKYATEGSGKEQLLHPQGLALGPGGVEYITDARNGRISKWAQPGPAEATSPATAGINKTEATLSSTLHASGLEATYQFEYGLTAAYGQSTPGSAEPIGEGVDAVKAKQTLTGLSPGTEYHLRVVATSAAGTTASGDIAFKTAAVTPTYSSTFGSNGTGDGKFNHAADVTTDSKGSLWVLDQLNNRVEKFNEKGEYVTKFGSEGTGNGQFKSPSALEVDSKGNVWVVDKLNNRVEKFNEKGEYVTKFGSGGGGTGQFTGAGPEGIAIDAGGNVWVSDTYGGRLLVFNEKGEYLKTVGSKGSGAGKFGEPCGLAIGPGGNLWIADWQNNRVAEFNEKGEYVRQFGTEGSGSGQLKHPFGIVVDTKGDVWVGDTGNNRIDQFNEKGEYVTQFGSAGSGAGQFSLTYPMGLAADSKGNIWIADSNNHRVQRWLIPNYVPTYGSSFGSEGTGSGQFKHPADAALDPNGNLWVVDKSNNRIEEFEESTEYVMKFGSSGTGNGQFSLPGAIAIDPKGNIWVADTGNKRVEKFNEKGEYVLKFGSSGTGNGQFAGSGPEGIAIDAGGNVWVTDTYGGRVERFNEKGEYLKSIGSKGSAPGQFGEPTGIEIGPGGNLWIADWQNNRVSEFNEKGEFVRQFGSEGSGNGQFKHPDAIDVDGRGNVWVGDQSNARIEEFNELGEYVTQFGASGSGAGQLNLSYPIGIETDSKGSLWITDANNNRVQRWNYVFG